MNCIGENITDDGERRMGDIEVHVGMEKKRWRDKNMAILENICPKPQHDEAK